jgi:hypothetical protein
VRDNRGHGSRQGGSPFTVAIHWAEDRPDRRSIPLDAFAPLAAVPGVRLVAVQKGPASDGLSAAPFPVGDLGPRLDTGPDALVDTSAVLAAADLVVTNDGPVAHLAGALGAAVWVALPFGPDWRWMAGRSDSPWYPSMRLFRQRRQGDWSGTFEEIARALRVLAAPRPPRLGKRGKNRRKAMGRGKVGETRRARAGQEVHDGPGGAGKGPTGRRLAARLLGSLLPLCTPTADLWRFWPLPLLGVRLRHLRWNPFLAVPAASAAKLRGRSGRLTPPRCGG